MERVRVLQILAGVFGCLAGIVGVAPYFVMSDVVLKRFIKDSSKSLKFTLLAPVLSFILMIVAMIVFWNLYRQYMIIFAVACVSIFLLGTISYALVQMKR